MVLTGINSEDVRGMSRLEIMDKIQSLGRPITLRFTDTLHLHDQRLKISDIKKKQPSNAKEPNEHQAFELIQRNDLLSLLELPQLDLSMTNPNGKTLLHYACRFKSLEIVQWLIEKGADPTVVCSKGRLPLHDAAAGGSVEICTIVALNPHAVDGVGMNMLHMASIHGHLEVVQWYLTECHGNIHSTNFGGKCALHYACFNGRIRVAKYLVACGINISAVDIRGWTALHYGAHGGQLSICQWLVYHEGIAIRALDEDGLIAAQVAKNGSEVKEYLTHVSAPPAPPSVPKFVSSTEDTITVSWGKQPLHGMVKLEVYELQYGKPYVGTWTTVCDCIDAQATQYTTPCDGEVVFRIRSKSSNGWSDYSKRSAMMLPAAKHTSDMKLGKVQFEVIEGRHFEMDDEAYTYYCIIEVQDHNRIRSLPGELQEKYSQSFHASNHPKFKACTMRFNVYETKCARVTVDIMAHREPPTHPDRSIGSIELDALSLVCGLPAKRRWISLQNASSGEVLITSFFTPSYVDTVRHSTGIECNSAAQWLALDRPPEVMYDTLGFIVDPIHFHAYREAVAYQQCQRSNQSIWRGLLPDTRSEVYLKVSGGLKKRQALGSEYYRTKVSLGQQLVDELIDASDESFTTVRFKTVYNQIQVDLDRTFAGNQSFINTDAGRGALGRVLLAYAVHNSSLGYCQSMNFIAARLLCIMDEESAFWVLMSICEDLFPSYYIVSMRGVQIDAMMVANLVKLRLPKLSYHLNRLSTPVALISTQWLLTVFCNNFPSETTYRLLDVILSNGSEMPFAIILAHLRIHTKSLLLCRDYLEINETLRLLEAGLFDVDYLLEIAQGEVETLGTQVTLLREKLEAEFDADLASKSTSIQLLISNANESKITDALLLYETLSEDLFCELITNLAPDVSSHNVIQLFELFRIKSRPEMNVREFCCALIFFSPSIESKRERLTQCFRIYTPDGLPLAQDRAKQVIFAIRTVLNIQIAEFLIEDRIQDYDSVDLSTFIDLIESLDPIFNAIDQSVPTHQDFLIKD